MKFNERLKKFREDKSLTQVQLSDLTGISARMIQKYEAGTARPRLDAAEKIAKALNITTDELLGNADMLVAQAAEKYGARGAKQAKQTDRRSDRTVCRWRYGRRRYGLNDESHSGCLLDCKAE